uniref:C2H2-type domain-containing protein n=1 Tax=Anopheles atroparvus TaxID=41427 RepID=A0AAG5DTG3_ANOAO
MPGAQHSLLKYNVLRWQNISSRLKKKPSLAAPRSNKRFDCVHCFKNFVHMSGLERHKEKFHAEGVGTTPPGKLPYFVAVPKCMSCGVVFPNTAKYADH